MRNKKAYVIGGFTVLFAAFCLPFWKALSLAAIFSLAIYSYLPKKGKGELPGKIVIMATTAIVLAMMMPILFGIYSFSSNVINFSKQENSSMFSSQNIKNRISKKADAAIDYFNIPFSGSTRDIIEKSSGVVADNVLEYATETIKSIPDLVLEVIVFALGLYIFLSYAANIRGKIIKLKILTDTDLQELVKVLQEGSFQCLVTLLLVGGIQAVTVIIGAAIAGFSNLGFIFLITFLLSFIPIIGAAPVAFSLSLIKVFQGDVPMALLMFTTGLIAGSIDNIVKPLLLKRGIEFDGAMSLIIILGSIIVLGIPGLVIGPVVGTTVAHYYHKID